MRNSVKMILGVGLLAMSAGADTYTVDPNHSEIAFSVRHMLVSNVKGNFSEFSGSFDYNPEDLASFSAAAIVSVASIDTRNADRDEHLRSADFFDAEQFPEIAFKVTRVDVGAGDPVLYGDLTMRGVTKEIALPVLVSGPVKDMSGNMRAGFEGAARINRQDWGVSWSKTMDGGGLVVGDDVRLLINVEGVRAESASAAAEAIAEEDAVEAAQD